RLRRGARLSPPPRGATVLPYTTLFRSTDVVSTHEGGCQRRRGLRAAPASSKRLTRVRCGAVRTLSGSSAASRLLASIASTKASLDRKSTRLNSSHVKTSYAVFCSTKDG